MIFKPTSLKDVLVVVAQPQSDERGFFARTFCAREFADQGLDGSIAQTNISYNARAGTLRGMHFQLPPHEETKLVRCTRGAIYDVVIDLRRQSETYLRWFGIELRADDPQRKALYVPKGFAHGFLSLVAETEVSYLISEFYAPQAAHGIRYNDPLFQITWPVPVTVIRDRDREWPDYEPEAATT